MPNADSQMEQFAEEEHQPDAILVSAAWVYPDSC